jgi:hypothetical protein
VGLVAAEAGAVERVEAERRGVDREEQDPDREIPLQTLRPPARGR